MRSGAKESVRWLESLDLTQQVVPAEVEVVTIADREADIYELFAHRRSANSNLLIRAAQNRKTKRDEFSEEVQPLFDVLAGSAIAGVREIELQRTPRRQPRQALLTVRYAHVWLQPPAHLSDLEPIEVWAVLAEEEQPPAGERAVRWLLLSTSAIEDYESACECLRRYSLRWLIERYFYSLKTGCQVEQLQLERSDRLERAVATYSIVAWRLMWLMYEARRHPERSVEGIFIVCCGVAIAEFVGASNEGSARGCADDRGVCAVDCEVRWFFRTEGGWGARNSDAVARVDASE